MSYVRLIFVLLLFLYPWPYDLCGEGMPKISITFKVTHQEKKDINSASSVEELTTSDYVRQAVMSKLNGGKTASDNRLTSVLQAQLSTKDDQIKKLQQTAEGLQQSLDQAQQLHAMSEQRHQAELAKIEGRGFIQRLKAVFS